MNTTVRHGAVVILLVLFAACGSSGPTSPTGTNAPPALPPPPDRNFPPLSGPSRTFIFDRELSYPVRDDSHTRKSRFVLYDNGAFGLQYLSLRQGLGYEYRGEYQDANGVIMFLFEFNGRKVGSPLDDATGTLNGDSLTVHYHEIMRHADFEDAVYVLMP
jgi:hypothetical protein